MAVPAVPGLDVELLEPVLTVLDLNCGKSNANYATPSGSSSGTDESNVPMLYLTRMASVVLIVYFSVLGES